MANQKHLAILKQGVEHWNKWREDNPRIIPDLSNSDLSNLNLKEAYLADANLMKADLTKANLYGAVLSDAKLYDTLLNSTNFTKATLVRTILFNSNIENSDFSKAKLSNANLSMSTLKKTSFFRANLSSVNFSNANVEDVNFIDSNLTKVFFLRTQLRNVNFTQATLYLAHLAQTIFIDVNFTGATLSHANFIWASLNQVDLTKAKLIGTTLISTSIENCSMNSCYVYGVSIWDLKESNNDQKNLIITPLSEPVITVDNIEIAQFIYLLLNNQKIKNAIGTIAQKGVLILGRFTPERKKVLDIIRENLRNYDFVLIMFDFEKVESRDYTETVKILAGMSRFVIVDVTHQSSCPLELQATVPDYKIPFLPIILKGEKPFAMLIDLIRKYEWVSGVLEYESEEELMNKFQKEIIDEALIIEKNMKEKERQSYYRDNR